MNSIADITLPITDTRVRQSRSSQGAEIIKQRIKQGMYKPGEKLPSMRSLSSELNLSVPAVQRAVRQLEKEAILESRHGVGIRILDSADCNGTPLLFGFVQPYFSRFSLALQHYLEQALDSRSNLCVVKSTHNEPERERREIERLIASNINGLLVWPVDGDTNGEFLQAVSQRLPVVFVDRTLEDMRSAAVVLDYESGGRQIIRDLHQKGYERILVVCDPIDISSFRQLKTGLREEASLLGLSDSLTIFDYPVIHLIESYHRKDYSMADVCYEELLGLIQSGQYDAIFCPQSEFFDQVFAGREGPNVLAPIKAVTLCTPEGPPLSRHYYQLNVEEWHLDTIQMLVSALDLLQDMTQSRMTLSRRPRERVIWIPIVRHSPSDNS